MSPRKHGGFTACMVLLFGVVVPPWLRGADLGSIEPRSAVAASQLGLGGTTVTVRGTGLLEGTDIRLASRAAQASLLALTFGRLGTSATGRVPNLPAGTYDVELHSSRGGLLDTLRGALRVEDGVTLAGVAPSVVEASGGTRITLVGTGFSAATLPEVGGKRLVDVTVLDGEHLEGTVPELAAGFHAAELVVVGATRVVLARLEDAVQAGSPSVDLVEAGFRRLEAQSKAPVGSEFDRGRLRAVLGRFPAPGADAPERALGFLDRYPGLFGLSGPRRGLFVRRLSAPEDGVECVVFHQTLGGIPVQGGRALVFLQGDEVLFATAKLLEGRGDLDVLPRVSLAEAAEAARAAVADPGARLIGEARLVVFDLGLLLPAVREPSRPRLAWKLTLVGGAQKRAFVDAHDGTVITAYDLRESSGGSYHGLDIKIWDAEDESSGWGDCHWHSSDTAVATESWFSDDYVSDTDAIRANVHIRQTYAFYHDYFNRHSWNGDYEFFEVFVHATTQPPGNVASWFRWPCNLMDIRTGGVDREVITHEFTHGVIQATSGLEYWCESGALNEHYADAMAMCHDRIIEGPAGGNDPEWLLADQLSGGGGAIRDFQNPAITHYSEVDFDADQDYPDNGRVHTNSQLGNLASYLMVDGGTYNGNFTQGGLAIWKLARLKYMTLRFLSEEADYSDARNSEVFWANYFYTQGLHQFTALDVCRVKSAWAVVGRGKGDFNCDGTEEWTNPDSDGDEVPDSWDNCDGVPNLSQVDLDGDGKGDACDSDRDGDGYQNGVDGCPDKPNLFYQYAPCWDLDFDGVDDSFDNCPEVPNASQTDADEDGIGNVCEPDGDEDGVENDQDNCPVTPNPGQENADGDFYGDACDLCPDVEEPYGAYTVWGTPFQPDSDEDGIPDACDHSYGIGSRDGWTKEALIDGSAKDIAVDGAPSAVVTLPFALCPGGDCPEWFDPKFRFQLRFVGGGPHVKYFVTDDAGRVVAEAGSGAPDSDLRFAPLGGAGYSLNLSFSPAFPGGRVRFDAELIPLLEPDPLPTFRRGDSNSDARVDISDALQTLGFLFLGASEPGCLDAADSNDDALLNISDAIFSLTYLFSGGPPIPDPGIEDCGLDAGESLGCLDPSPCP